MNFNLSQMPDRNQKPRTYGITMVMDKGLSINDVHNFMSIAEPHVDIVKLGFGTSFVTPNLREKLKFTRAIMYRCILEARFSKPFNPQPVRRLYCYLQRLQHNPHGSERRLHYHTARGKMRLY